jgi:high-affinity iron transporter
MVFWMSRHARHIKGSLEQSMKASVLSGATWSLFGLAFLTVAREGIETALFLSASAFQTSGMATLSGGIAGLLAAIAVAWAVYVAGARLNLRLFFKVAGILLIIFGAVILRYGIHEFEEIGWLPPLIDHIWNTGQWIPAGSVAGTIMQALLGYTSTPSLLQIIGYLGYLAVMFSLTSAPVRRRNSTPAVPPATTTESPTIQAAEAPERATRAEHVGV